MVADVKPLTEPANDPVKAPAPKLVTDEDAAWRELARGWKVDVYGIPAIDHMHPERIAPDVARKAVEQRNVAHEREQHPGPGRSRRHRHAIAPAVGVVPARVLLRADDPAADHPAPDRARGYFAGLRPRSGRC